MDKRLTYFVSDVHLGLRVGDPAGREAAFVEFLRSIKPEETESLYLLGDIWDFWYEYRDVVPRGYIRVLGALVALADAGVKVFFFPGNHDLWTKSYFADNGIVSLEQPYETTIGGKVFCLGHGDALGPGNHRYKFMKRVFRSRISRTLFSSLHPWLAYRLGNGWSGSSRAGKPIAYDFKGPGEPLYVFCENYPGKVDFFVFGHYHSRADIPVGGGRLLLLGDWMTAPNWAVFDAASGELEAYLK